MEPSDVDPSIAALERSLALNRARQRDLRDEEAVIFSQLQELRSSAKQAAKDAEELAAVPGDPAEREKWVAAAESHDERMAREFLARARDGGAGRDNGSSTDPDAARGMLSQLADLLASQRVS